MTASTRPNAGALLAIRRTAPTVGLAVNASFAALSVNPKLVNKSAPDLFPVQFTLC